MATIGVKILGDATSLERAFRKSEKSATVFAGKMSAVNQASRGALTGSGFSKGALLFGSGAFVGAAIGTEVLKNSITAASDLNEQLSKSRQVFGDASESIEAFGNSSAKSLGISKREAIAAASTFGNLFRTVDLAPSKNAELSSSLVSLAGDLASFNNVNVDDALLALRSGIIGEAEPLRKFGVLLSEARVQQQALADTGKKSVKALTDQEKVLARYEIIIKDTKTAQGDFARTSSGLANQTRILKANFSDLASQLGQTFLPATNAAVGGLNTLIGAIRKEPPKFDFKDVLQNLSALRRARDEMAAFAGEGDIRTKALTRALSDLEKEAGTLSSVYNAHLSPALRQVTTDTEGYTRSLADAADRSQGLTTVTGILATDMADAATRIAAATEQINAAANQVGQTNKRFTVFLKGLDLKLDKAELTGSIDKQIAVLREREQAIIDREAKVGKKFDLEVELTAVRKDIKDLQSEKMRSALADQQAREAKILALKQQQRDELRKQLEAQRKLAAEAQRALDLATGRARSLFGSLFAQIEEGAHSLAILGGSRGKKTVALPGAGGGEDAKGLLTDLTTQIKSFKKLQASILELQRKGAPKSLIEAARSGEISADQINALADANAQTLNKIFKNVRLADKLISRAAKAEITTKNMAVRAQTVTVQGATSAFKAGGGPREGGFVINGGVHLHGIHNPKEMEAALERRAKQRAGQRRGRTGGKR